ncbi:MAG: hypothetical protein ABIP78_03420 [Pyrinomonadaceae bacterium]
MLEKYRATIHGNVIEWDGEVPDGARNDDAVKVYVTFVDKPVIRNKPDGKRAAAALQKIADMGGVKSIPDPDKWLHEIRKDRPLPGRE